MTEFGFQPVIETVERLPIKRSRPFASEVRRWLVVGADLLGSWRLVLSVCSLIAAIYMSARTDQERPVDAIVVMGAAQFNGRPSAVLRGQARNGLPGLVRRRRATDHRDRWQGSGR